MSLVKTVSLILTALSGAKKLYEIVKKKILAAVRKEAIDKAINEKDTTDIEHIINE